MAIGNGRKGKDLLLDLLAEVRELGNGQRKVLAAVGGTVGTIVKIEGTLEALIEREGEQDARIDDLESRVSKLERG